MLDDLHGNHPGIIRMKTLAKFGGLEWTYLLKKKAKLSLFSSASKYATSRTDTSLGERQITMGKSRFRFCGTIDGEDVFDNIRFLF